MPRRNQDHLLDPARIRDRSETRRRRIAQAAAHEARKRSAKAPRKPRADDAELELELRQARLAYGARS